MSPTQVLHEAHALGSRFTAVHAIHVTDDDIRLLRGSTVCVCPTTERDLADGIAPSGRLRDGGVHLAVGSDSNAVVDLLEEARAIELDTRLASGERGTHSAVELLRARRLAAARGSRQERRRTSSRSAPTRHDSRARRAIWSPRSSSARQPRM